VAQGAAEFDNGISFAEGRKTIESRASFQSMVKITERRKMTWKKSLNKPTTTLEMAPCMRVMSEMMREMISPVEVL